MSEPTHGHGYVTDLPYLTRSYPQYAPAYLRLSATLAGFEMPGLQPGSAVLELGCGYGNLVISAAAAYPDCDFVGVDFNPSHIAAARQRAADLGLTNITLLDADFSDLADDPHVLPDCDLVICHGVYSWVAPSVRHAIQRILARHVRPGGLVFISYNVLPGSASMSVLQRALYETASLSVGRSDHRVGEAITRIKAMHTAGAAHLAGNKLIESLLESFDEADPAYLAHEYINTNWSALYHADVARDMEQARLTYIGSATPYENFPALLLQPQQNETLSEIPVSSVRETLRDYFMERVLRKDLYVRGPRRLTELTRDRTLDECVLAAGINPEDATYRVTVPAGRIDLEDPFREACERLWREERLPLGALMAGPFANTEQNRPETVALLLSGGLAVPSLEAPGEATRAACRRALARAVEAVHDGGLQARPTVLVPRLGCEQPVGGLEALVLDALARGRPQAPEILVPELWAYFEEMGEVVMHKGESISDTAQCHALLIGLVRDMLSERVPLWRALGMLLDTSDGAESTGS